MAAGLKQILEHMESQILLITPDVDPEIAFKLSSYNGTLEEQRWSGNPDKNTRHFSVLPMDSNTDAVSWQGDISCLATFRDSIMIRVLYNTKVTVNAGLKTVMTRAHTDAKRIVKRLVHPSVGWGIASGTTLERIEPISTEVIRISENLHICEIEIEIDHQLGD